MIVAYTHHFSQFNNLKVVLDTVLGHTTNTTTRVYDDPWSMICDL